MLKERCQDLGDINLVTADGSIDRQVHYVQEFLSVLCTKSLYQNEQAFFGILHSIFTFISGVVILNMPFLY